MHSNDIVRSPQVFSVQSCFIHDLRDALGSCVGCASDEKVVDDRGDCREFPVHIPDVDARIGFGGLVARFAKSLAEVFVPPTACLF